MMYLTNHTTEGGGIFLFNLLTYLTKAESLEGTLLVNGITDLTLNLLNLYSCHSLYTSTYLTSKYFIHTDATIACHSVGVTHQAQSLDGGFHQIVRVRRTL